MKIENQVSSLQPSKRLKELGVKQDSLFYWHNIDTYPSIMYGDSTEWAGDELISAFTVAELGEMLPLFIIMNNGIYFQDKKEADSRAKILIYLLENGL
ncbi:MAG: hypothetical protein AABY22_10685 [Nanoarchaeota archaeon]